MKHGVMGALFAFVVLSLAGCGPDKSIAYYNLGLDAITRQDYNEAIRDWNEALKYNPDDPDIRFNLGSAYLQVKRYREAEEHLRRAAELRPQDPDAQELLGESLERQGKLPEAKHAYEFALSVKSTHVPAVLGLASIALTENQNKSAESYAARAAELDPNNVRANMLLAEAYFRNGDYNAAYAQLITARRLGPTNPDLLLLSGKVDSARRQYAEALSALDDARKLGVSSEELFYYLGLVSLAMGDISGAEKNFRLAIFKDGQSSRAWKGLAETYIAAKKWSDASEAVAKAAALDPADPGAVLDRAIISMDVGDPATAARDLEALRVRDDAPPIANYYLGHAYLRLKENARAREAFQRFVASWEGDSALSEEAKGILETLAR